MPPSAALAVEDLSVTRGDRTLLRNLTFAVAPGEILHVQGANGSGKTSLLEVLGGLRPAAAGRRVGIVDPERLHWVGHRNAVSAALTPEENLRFWCRLHGASDDAIQSALETFGLWQQRRRPCRLLSMGQRRRVALARLALVHRPLWLLDEPLSSLDAGGVGVLIGLLGAHAAGGGAAIVTSHQAFPPELQGLRRLELG